METFKPGDVLYRGTRAVRFVRYERLGTLGEMARIQTRMGEVLVQPNVLTKTPNFTFKFEMKKS